MVQQIMKMNEIKCKEKVFLTEKHRHTHSQRDIHREQQWYIKHHMAYIKQKTMLENSFISQFWNVIKINIETNHIYTQREQRARVKIGEHLKKRNKKNGNRDEYKYTNSRKRAW